MLTAVIVIAVVVLVILGTVAAVVGEHRTAKKAVQRGDPTVVKRYTSSFLAQSDIKTMARSGYRVSTQGRAKVFGSKNGVMVTYERVGAKH